MNRIVLFLICSLMVVPNSLMAQEAESEAPAAAAADSEETKLMQRMQDYGTPNENHERLKKLEGTWTASITHQMAPGDESHTFEGSTESRMVMGGRYLEQDFRGTFMDTPFEGRSIYGYDNMKEEYQVIWFDNMSTGIMSGFGQYDPESDTITEEGTLSCPFTNEDKRWYRAVTTFIDDDHYTYESFMHNEQGEEFRAMLIEYKRVNQPTTASETPAASSTADPS